MSNEKIKIQVLGSGCPSCKKLYELTKQAVQELGIETEVEYVTEIGKIIEMGVMQTPVLAINDKPVMAGSVPDKERIKELIANKSGDSAPEQKCACNCGGSC